MKTRGLWTTNYVQVIKITFPVLNPLRVALRALFKREVNICIPVDWLSKKGLREFEKDHK